MTDFPCSPSLLFFFPNVCPRPTFFAPTFLGIDSSNKTLVLCLRRPDDSAHHFTLANHIDTFRAFLETHHLLAPTSVVTLKNTGRYNWAVYQALAALGPAFQGVCLRTLPPRTQQEPGPGQGQECPLCWRYAAGGYGRW